MESMVWDSQTRREGRTVGEPGLVLGHYYCTCGGAMCLSLWNLTVPCKCVCMCMGGGCLFSSYYLSKCNPDGMQCPCINTAKCPYWNYNSHNPYQHLEMCRANITDRYGNLSGPSWLTTKG
ncbi:hypothetical protein GDO86_013868 [Hymenochirus boettgeri]|uniref:Uncharacterized protein n=1 Tax=Hymenochirus boettgeri TaxID=247094 RepID=A0A8T2JUZ5_9PIPI|nr:hypothetical protein GDO86_013868 [Hymenochirus boettgeri]